jgi:hypothetical protein
MIIEAARPARVATPKAEYMMEILIFSAVESPSFEWSNWSSVNSEDTPPRAFYRSEPILTGYLDLTPLYGNIKS